MSLSQPFAKEPGFTRRSWMGRTGPALVAGFFAGFQRSEAKAATAVPAVDSRMDSFDQRTWPLLLAQLPRPAIVLFSSLHCPTCPEAARRAFETRNRLHPQAPLVVVLTDGEDDLTRSRTTYQTVATRLMVFDGLPAVLRREVSSRWRGETPWFALLNRDGSVLMQAGLPGPSQWEAWARNR